MGSNTKYRTTFTAKDGCRYRVTFMSSGGFEDEFIIEDIGEAVLINAPAMEGGYDKWPVGLPSKIPNARLSVLLNNVPQYMREKIITPSHYPSVTVNVDGVEGAYGDTIETQNVWIIETDRGTGGDFETVFQGMQNAVPEDLYKKDSSGRRIVEISMIAAEVAAHRAITSEMLRYQSYYYALFSGATRVTTTLFNTAYKYSTGAEWRFWHLSLSEGNSFLMLPVSILMQSLEKLFQTIMRRIMRDEEYPAEYNGQEFSHVLFYKPNNLESDYHNPDTSYTIENVYFVAAIHATPGDGFPAEPNQWVAGLLSNDKDSFEGAGYTNVWDLLHWITVNFFAKGQVRPGRIEFSKVQESLNEIISVPEFTGTSKEFRRGASIVVGCEATVQGATSDDLGMVATKVETASINQEVPPVQMLFTNAPSVPLFEDGELLGITSGGGFAVVSGDVHMHGLYMLHESDVVDDEEVMLRAHVQTAIHTGTGWVTVPEYSGGGRVDDYEYPDPYIAGFSGTFTPEMALEAGEIWSDVRAAYIVQQRSSGLPYAIAQAMLQTYGNYFQGVTTGDVPKRYAQICDVGDRAEVDLTDIDEGLSVISQDAILINVSVTDGRVSKADYLHRGFYEE